MDASEVRLYLTIVGKIREKDAELQALKDEKAKLESQLYDAFSDQGISKLEVDGVTVYLHRQLWARTKDGADRHRVAEALRVSGLGQFVTETFNYQTLSAYVRELDGNGESVPEDLADVIDITEVFSVRTRKSG